MVIMLNFTKAHLVDEKNGYDIEFLLQSQMLAIPELKS